MKYRLALVNGKSIFLCLQACKIPAVALLFCYGIKHNHIRHLKPYKAINSIEAQRQNCLYFGGCCSCLRFARVAFTRCITVSRFWTQYSRLFSAEFLRRAISAHSEQQYFRYTDIKVLPHTGQIRLVFWLDNCNRLRSFPAASCRRLRSVAQAAEQTSTPLQLKKLLPQMVHFFIFGIEYPLLYFKITQKKL